MQTAGMHVLIRGDTEQSRKEEATDRKVSNNELITIAHTVISIANGSWLTDLFLFLLIFVFSLLHERQLICRNVCVVWLCIETDRNELNKAGVFVE